MNTDDFEKQLERHRLRQPPAEWRGEILAAARANIRKTETARTESTGMFAGWRALLARIPLAWGAVAAVWAVIIGVNLLLSGPTVAVMAGSPASSPPDKLTLWSLQRAEISLLADHPTETPEPARRLPAPGTTPRSDRRREEGFGGFERDDEVTRMV